MTTTEVELHSNGSPTPVEPKSKPIKAKGEANAPRMQSIQCEEATKARFDIAASACGLTKGDAIDLAVGLLEDVAKDEHVETAAERKARLRGKR